MTMYCGEMHCWEFDHYITVPQEQHTILEGLMQYSYAGIDECSKTL